MKHLLCLSLGPNWIWTVQINLVNYQPFWMRPIHFGWVQIIKISSEKSNLNLMKIILTRTKRFGPDINNLYSPKQFWINWRTRHLSFYTSKTIFDGSKLVWAGPNMTFNTKFCTLIHVQNVLNLSRTIWKCPKSFWTYRRTRNQSIS